MISEKAKDKYFFAEAAIHLDATVCLSGKSPGLALSTVAIGAVSLAALFWWKVSNPLLIAATPSSA
jgi:hypothetical protein